MTIFGTLVALTVPTMKSWIADAKVRAVADTIQNGVRLAQAESLRRGRQVVFALTTSTTPQTVGFSASANGTNWAVQTIPLMTDGSETATVVQSGALSGVLSSTASSIQVTGPAAICFNSLGRLIAVSSANTGITGGACTAPTSGTPPMFTYLVQLSGADHSMQVEVSLGGQVHLCDPSQTLSSTNPYGC